MLTIWNIRKIGITVRTKSFHNVFGLIHFPHMPEMLCHMANSSVMLFRAILHPPLITHSLRKMTVFSYASF